MQHMSAELSALGSDASGQSPWGSLYQSHGFSPKSLFPPLIWVPQYWRSMHGTVREEDRPFVGSLPFSLKGDAIAGVTVGIMLVPQCLALALMAGLPVQTGLYASFAPLLVYAMFGTMRQAQNGPTALMSLISGQALDSLGLTNSAERMAGAALLSLLVGAMSIALGVLRFGNVVNFMSHSVLSAFCTASGIIIATSQIKDMLGIKIPRSEYWWETVRDLAENVEHTHGPTLALGTTILVLLLTLKAWKAAGSAEKRRGHFMWRWFPREKTSIPFRAMKLAADLSPFVAVTLGGLWAWAYRASGIKGVKLVGEVDSSGFILVIPGKGLYSKLLSDSTLPVSALMIAVIGFLETMAVGTKFAQQYKYIFDPNQEFIALGLGNVASAVFSGFPTTGGFSRAAVNVSFGATSLLACAITSVLVFAAVYVLLPAIALLPLACMAPIMIQGALIFIDVHELRVALRCHPWEFLVMLSTLAVCLALTVREGLLVGFGLSVLTTLYEISTPNMAVCGEVKNNWRDVRYFPEAQQPRNAVVVRMDAALHFANANKFKDFVVRAARLRETLGAKVEYILIDAKSINRVDLSACDMLADLAAALSVHQQKIVLTNLKAPVAATLHVAGVHSQLMKHGGHVCLDLADAVALAEAPSPEWTAADEAVGKLVETRAAARRRRKAALAATCDSKDTAPAAGEAPPANEPWEPEGWTIPQGTSTQEAGP